VFEIVDVLLVNKIDAMSFFDFDMKKLEERVKALNPDITVLPVSAKTGEGIDAWAAWLEHAVAEWKRKR